MPGFEGTTRFTSPTLSRFELSRPFPAFSGCAPGSAVLQSGNCMNMTERNDGSMTYDSAQFVANKRFTKGITVNATYTYVPRWNETRQPTTAGQAFIDAVSMTPVDGPYFSHRKHRITASGVWEMPWLRDRTRLGRPARSAAGRLRRCSSTSQGSPGTSRTTSSSRSIRPWRR